MACGVPGEGSRLGPDYVKRLRRRSTYASEYGTALPEKTPRGRASESRRSRAGCQVSRIDRWHIGKLEREGQAEEIETAHSIANATEKSRARMRGLEDLVEAEYNSAR